VFTSAVSAVLCTGCGELVLAVAFMLIVAACDRLPDDWPLAAVLVLPMPLLPVQRALNRVNALAWGEYPRRWTRWEKVAAWVLGVFWALVVVTLLMPAGTEDGQNRRLTDLARHASPTHHDVGSRRRAGSSHLGLAGRGVR